MAFAFMDIAKIKTEGQLTSKYNHNCRMVQIDNVIPELTEKNETLVELPKQAGKQLSYNEAFKDRLSTLDYYKDHNIRSNAVLGYEVLLTFSREADIDLESWKKQSVEWLHKTFDVAPDGRSNVLHAEFHADEVGNVHIHSFVVPIDERGRLNAKRFTDGSKAMSNLQSSYANSVSNLGLQRGIAGSSAKHRDIRKMYANLNNAMKLPEILENESAYQYKERVIEEMQTMLASGMRKTSDFATKTRQDIDRQKQEEREEIARELRKTQKISKHETKKLEEEKKLIQAEAIGYEDMVKMLQEQMNDMQFEMSEMQKKLQKELNDENARNFYKDIQTGLSILNEENPEEANIIREDIEYLQELALLQKEEMERQEEEIQEEQEIDDLMS